MAEALIRIKQGHWVDPGPDPDPPSFDSPPMSSSEAQAQARAWATYSNSLSGREFDKKMWALVVGAQSQDFGKALRCATDLIEEDVSYVLEDYPKIELEPQPEELPRWVMSHQERKDLAAHVLGRLLADPFYEDPSIAEESKPALGRLLETTTDPLPPGYCDGDEWDAALLVSSVKVLLSIDPGNTHVMDQQDVARRRLIRTKVLSYDPTALTAARLRKYGTPKKVAIAAVEAAYPLGSASRKMVEDSSLRWKAWPIAEDLARKARKDRAACVDEAAEILRSQTDPETLAQWAQEGYQDKLSHCLKQVMKYLPQENDPPS